MKACESCPEPAIPGERFCGGCRRELLKEMERSGYLTKPPPTAHHEAAVRSTEEVNFSDLERLGRVARVF